MAAAQNAEQKAAAEKAAAESQAKAEQEAAAKAAAEKAEAEKAAAEAAATAEAERVEVAEKAAEQLQVTGPVAVLALKSGGERYVYRGAPVSTSEFTADAIAHAKSVGLVGTPKQ